MGPPYEAALRIQSSEFEVLVVMVALAAADDDA